MRPSSLSFPGAAAAMSVEAVELLDDVGERVAPEIGVLAERDSHVVADEREARQSMAGPSRRSSLGWSRSNSE